MRERPEYIKAKKHLDDPTNQEFWPTTALEFKALKTVKGQRAYTESMKRRRENERERQKQLDKSKDVSVASAQEEK